MRAHQPLLPPMPARPAWWLAVCLALCLLVAGGCANIGAPTGGKRDDKGPELRAANPPNQTLRFAGRTLTFAFDEFLNPTAQDVFISPLTTPKPLVLVSGKRLIIRFQAPLQDSTTYVVTLGRGIKDANEGNPLAAPYVYAVSTGSQIDTGTVAGRIVAAQDGSPRTGYTVLLFAADSIRADSFADRRPLYATQADTGGYFALTYVRPGRYRLLAIGDADNNYRLAPGGVEPVASTPPGVSDLIILTDSQPYAERLLLAYRADGGPPRVASVQVLNPLTVEVQFAEPLTAGQARWAADTATQALPAAAWPGAPAPTTWRLPLPNPLTDSLLLHLTALTDTAGFRADTALWIRRPPLPPDSLLVLEEIKPYTQALVHHPLVRLWQANAPLPPPDTLLPYVHLTDTTGQQTLPVKLTVQGTVLQIDLSAAAAVDLKKPWLLRLDSLLPSAPLPATGRVLRTARPQEVALSLTDPATLGIVLGTVLPPVAPPPDSSSTTATAHLHHSDDPDHQHDDHNHTADTAAKPYAGSIVVVLQETGSATRRVSCPATPQFRFDHLPPGTYRIGLLYDADNNRQWTPPRLSPRTAGEVFVWLPGQVQVRANWEIELPPLQAP